MIGFLNGGNDLPEDIAEELLINTKLENLERLKFDDQKWEIDETRFLIFGKVIKITFLGKYEKLNKTNKNKTINRCDRFIDVIFLR